MSTQGQLLFSQEMALVAVRCPVHSIGMIPRPFNRQSAEARWCGAWWDCPKFRCGCTILFDSPELRAQNEEFARRKASSVLPQQIPNEVKQ